MRDAIHNLRNAGTGEDAAADGAGEHAIADVASVGGLVTCSAA